MKYILVLCFAILAACNSQEQDHHNAPASEALKSINDSVKGLLESNGGYDNWKRVTELSFVKETRMYLPDSTTEMRSAQRQTFSNYPSFQAEIVYLEDSLNRRIVQEGNDVSYFENGSEVMDLEKVKRAATSIQVAYYVIALPFKLMDDGVNFLDMKLDTMLGEGLAKSLHVVHESNPHQNWWIYFDKDNDLMKGYLIEHDNRFSYIVNDEVQMMSGFQLPLERRSIALDSSFANPYLRADYVYSDYSLNYKK